MDGVFTVAASTVCIVLNTDASGIVTGTVKASDVLAIAIANFFKMLFFLILFCPFFAFFTLSRFTFWKKMFDLIIDVKSSIFNIKKRNFHIENFVKL